MKTKVKSLTAKTPEELTNKINSIKEEIKATQIMESRNEWVAFVYYVEDNLIENEKKPEKRDPNEPASKKQKWKLKKLGIEFDKEIKKSEAYNLIKENVENDKRKNN